VRKVRLSPTLGLRAAAAELGWSDSRHSARRLARYLRRKERVLGVQIIQRTSDAQNACQFVTLATLRQYCPELVDRRSEALEIIREHVNGLHDSVAELRLRDSALAARIRENSKAIERLATRVPK
jgi:hypothetical protein